MPVAGSSPYTTTQGPQTPRPPGTQQTPQNFNQSTEAQFANPNFLNQIAGYLGGAAAPGIAQAGLQSAEALQQAGLSGAGLGVGEANLASDTGYGIANALLTEQGLGLQSQGLGQQAQTQAEQQAIEQGQYGLSQQGIEQQLAELKAQYPGELQNQLGGAAASGASNSIGNRVATGQLEAFNGPGGFQEQSLYRQQQLAALGQQSEKVGFQGQQAQNQNAMQQLQLAAKQAGIPVQQAVSQLGYGLQQLGIQADPTQLIGQAATAQGTAAGDYAAVLSQAGATTGLGANFLSFGQ